MANVHDVANYIVQNFDSSISTMKLQKLAFFSQCWSLSLTDETLFDEEFQAWVKGPVCYDLFDEHRGQWMIDSWDHGSASNLGRRQKVIIDAVIDNFGALSGHELSEITHLPGTPWSKVREEQQVGPSQRCATPIPIDYMTGYFGTRTNA